MTRFYFLFIISLLFIPTIQAKTRYQSFISEGHQVLFFFPVTLTATEGKDKFEYDFTHQEMTDSVTFNFSIISKAKPVVTDISLIDQDGIALSPKYFKVLYTEYLKGTYDTRVQTSFNYQIFKELYLTAKRLIYKVVVNGKEIEFEYKSSQWKKEQESMNILLNLFD